MDKDHPIFPRFLVGTNQITRREDGRVFFTLELVNGGHATLTDTAIARWSVEKSEYVNIASWTKI